MEFMIPFRIPASPEKISYQDKFFFIGSCFSEEIGYKMSEFKFNVISNPNGILYDPVSICGVLNRLPDGKEYSEEDVFYLDDLWHSWQHHSLHSGPDQQTMIYSLNKAQQEARAFLKEANWLIITPGTAFHYILKENGEPVANCHKAPANIFQKKLISSGEIIYQLLALIAKLQSFNPALKIIFTVSPVRHIRDGLIENNRSKANLIEAIHFVAENSERVFYFPSYEIVIDVLRDYRFFKNDFVHPSETATEFVFEKFCESFLAEDSMQLLADIKKVVTASHHKPFQRTTKAYKAFVGSQLREIRAIEAKFPSIDFTKEKNQFMN